MEIQFDHFIKQQERQRDLGTKYIRYYQFNDRDFFSFFFFFRGQTQANDCIMLDSYLLNECLF